MKTTETPTTILATDCREIESTHTTRADACPHCGAARLTGIIAKAAWECGNATTFEGRRSELCREREARQKAEAEVERLKALFNKLAEEVECGPECVSRFGDHCNCSRLKRANKVIIDFEELTNTKNETKRK
jgi:hypothetical protein